MSGPRFRLAPRRESGRSFSDRGRDVLDAPHDNGYDERQSRLQQGTRAGDHRASRRSPAHPDDRSSPGSGEHQIDLQRQLNARQRQAHPARSIGDGQRSERVSDERPPARKTFAKDDRGPMSSTEKSTGHDFREPAMVEREARISSGTQSPRRVSLERNAGEDSHARQQDNRTSQSHRQETPYERRSPDREGRHDYDRSRDIHPTERSPDRLQELHERQSSSYRGQAGTSDDRASRGRSHHRSPDRNHEDHPQTGQRNGIFDSVPNNRSSKNQTQTRPHGTYTPQHGYKSSYSERTQPDDLRTGDYTGQSDRNRASPGSEHPIDRQDSPPRNRAYPSHSHNVRVTRVREGTRSPNRGSPDPAARRADVRPHGRLDNAHETYERGRRNFSRPRSTSRDSVYSREERSRKFRNSRDDASERYVDTRDLQRRSPVQRSAPRYRSPPPRQANTYARSQNYRGRQQPYTHTGRGRSPSYELFPAHQRAGSRSPYYRGGRPSSRSPPRRTVQDRRPYPKRSDPYHDRGYERDVAFRADSVERMPSDSRTHYTPRDNYRGIDDRRPRQTSIASMRDDERRLPATRPPWSKQPEPSYRSRDISPVGDRRPAYPTRGADRRPQQLYADRRGRERRPDDSDRDFGDARRVAEDERHPRQRSIDRGSDYVHRDSSANRDRSDRDQSDLHRIDHQRAEKDRRTRSPDIKACSSPVGFKLSSKAPQARRESSFVFEAERSGSRGKLSGKREHSTDVVPTSPAKRKKLDSSQHQFQTPESIPTPQSARVSRTTTGHKAESSAVANPTPTTKGADATVTSRGSTVDGSIYERIGQVGEGTYGKVYKACHRQTGELVALKRIRMEQERDGFPITSMREIKLLQRLKHPGVVCLLEMMIERSSVYMVFEYMDHDLTGVLANPNITFEPPHIKDLAAQLFEGLAYLHHRGVLHRDIKGSNILLNNAGQLKLADFGLARFYQKSRVNADYTNRVITLWFRPPELLLGATAYDAAVDIWSAGCILVELFSKSTIFPGRDEIHQLETIYQVMGSPTPESWPSVMQLPWYELIKFNTFPERFESLYADTLSPAALDLSKSILSLDPTRRPVATQVLAHPYFTTEDPRPVRRTLLDITESHEWDTKQRRRDERAKKVKEEKDDKDREDKERSGGGEGKAGTGST